VALNRGDEVDAAQLFFYDLRNASGVIPESGAPRLSRFDDLRRIVALDGAIYLQTGPTTIIGFSSR